MSLANFKRFSAIISLSTLSSPSSFSTCSRSPMTRMLDLSLYSHSSLRIFFLPPKSVFSLMFRLGKFYCFVFQFTSFFSLFFFCCWAHALKFSFWSLYFLVLKFPFAFSLCLLYFFLLRLSIFYFKCVYNFFCSNISISCFKFCQAILISLPSWYWYLLSSLIQFEFFLVVMIFFLFNPDIFILRYKSN